MRLVFKLNELEPDAGIGRKIKAGVNLWTVVISATLGIPATSADHEKRKKMDPGKKIARKERIYSNGRYVFHYNLAPTAMAG